MDPRIRIKQKRKQRAGKKREEGNDRNKVYVQKEDFPYQQSREGRKYDSGAGREHRQRRSVRAGMERNILENLLLELRL